MPQVKAQINDDFMDKIDKILKVMGIYNNRSDYVREALRKQIKEDAKLIQDMDFNDI